MSPIAESSSSSSPKRRRIARDGDQEEVLKLDDQEDDYVPYVPVAQRRQAKLAQFASRGITSDAARKKKEEDEEAEREAAKVDEEREEERRRERARKERTLLQEAQEVHKQKAQEGEYISSTSMFVEAHIDSF